MLRGSFALHSRLFLVTGQAGHRLQTDEPVMSAAVPEAAHGTHGAARTRIANKEKYGAVQGRPGTLHGCYFRTAAAFYACAYT